MTIDLKLTSQHDIDVTNYDMSTITETERVAQNLKIRLLFFFNEWYLDTEKGIPYYSDILIKSPDIPKVESILINEIINTNDVLELLSFDSFFDTAKRKYSVTFQVNTTFGTTETIEVEV